MPVHVPVPVPVPDRSAFARDGFLIVRRFLTGDDLQTLSTNLDRYIRDVVPTLSDAHAFYDDRSRPETLKQMQHMAVDPFFRDYTRHPKWKALAEALLGEEARCDAPEWFNKPPRTLHPTPPHQDNHYFNLEPPSVLTIWLAVDPVDEENGCLRYLPGSHLRGRRPHAQSNVLGFSQGITDYGPADRTREVTIALEPGDAAVHHGWTVHRADPNRSTTRQRRSFALVFKGAGARVDEEGFRRYQDQLRAQHESLGLRG